MTPHRRLLSLLPVLALACLGGAFAQDIDSSKVTGGVQNFIEFTQIIPKMDVLLGNVFGIMTAMDVPGVVDTLSRVLSGIIFLTIVFIAWVNSGFNKRFNFMGLDGSPNNILMGALTILFLSTGVPRIMGEAGWAVWRVTYTSVEAKVHPVMDETIKKSTATLAQNVWRYAVTGLSAGAQPMMAAANYLRGDTDVSPDSMSGTAMREEQSRQADTAVENNQKYASIWQIGSLLIAGMYMAYIGVIFGSGLFVIFSATFLPVAFAMIPINSGLLWRQVGGMVSSIFVAGLAPGLMLVNVMTVFLVPINYLSRMMLNQSKAATDNAAYTQSLISTCLNRASSGNPLEKVTTSVTDQINPLKDVMQDFCVVKMTGLQSLYTLGQATVFIIIGLAVAAMLFIGMSGLSMMIFRELKGVVDNIFGGGGTVGNGSNGQASKMASALGNRMLGAAVGAAGVMTGNAQLASAGARSVVSGNNALSGAAASVVERGRDKMVQGQRDAKALEQRSAQRAERAEENKAREEASDKKYAERAQEGRAQREQQEAARRGEQETGVGSKTDPRSATSAGQYGGQPDGGAKPFNPTDTGSSVPRGGTQAGPSEANGSAGSGSTSGGQGGQATDTDAAVRASVASAAAVAAGAGAVGAAGAGASSTAAGAAAGAAAGVVGGAAVGAGLGAAASQGNAGAGRPAGRDDVSSQPVGTPAAGAAPEEAGPPDDVLDAQAGDEDRSAEGGPDIGDFEPNRRSGNAGAAPAAGTPGEVDTNGALFPGGGEGDPSRPENAGQEVDVNGPLLAGGGEGDPGRNDTALGAAAAATAAAATGPAERPATGPAGSPASSTAPAAFSPEGNAQLRAMGVSAAERDAQAVKDWHKLVNTPRGAQEQAYISQEQAHWDLERRGLLPSQRDENEARIRRYAQANGVSERDAEQTLKDARQLVQFDKPTPPKPASIAGPTQDQGTQAVGRAPVNTAQQQAQTRMETAGYQPAYTQEGNAQLRRELPSAAQRDQVAASELQLRANESGGVDGRYTSAAQARHELHTRGLLPSQIDENERRVDAYAQAHKVSPEDAYGALENGRGLVQYDQPAPPAPPAFASAADEQAVTGAWEQQAAQAREQSRLAPTLEEVYAQEEREGRLPSQRNPQA